MSRFAPPCDLPHFEAQSDGTFESQISSHVSKTEIALAEARALARARPHWLDRTRTRIALTGASPSAAERIAALIAVEDDNAHRYRLGERHDFLRWVDANVEADNSADNFVESCAAVTLTFEEQVRRRFGGQDD